MSLNDCFTLARGEELQRYNFSMSDLSIALQPWFSSGYIGLVKLIWDFAYQPNLNHELAMLIMMDFALDIEYEILGRNVTFFVVKIFYICFSTVYHLEKRKKVFFFFIQYNCI